MSPYEKNGVIITSKKNEESNFKVINLNYRGFNADFEQIEDVTNTQIEAFKVGVITSVNHIFNNIIQLTKDNGGIEKVKYEDLFPQQAYLVHECVSKRNKNGFVANQNYPCSLPIYKNNNIVSIVMNENGEYVDININDNEFIFIFNPDKKNK